MQYKIKAWIAHNKLNSILILLSLALLIFIKLSTTYFMYLGGLENRFNFVPLLWISFFPFILGLYAISLFFLLVYYMTNKSKSLSWKKISFSALPLLILLLIIPSMLIGKSGVHYFLRGYEKWVEKEFDVPAIRQWLTSLPVEYSEKTYHNIEDYPENLPKSITKLKPQYIYLGDFNEGRYVEFQWGGGFSHWGIRIGMEDMETPNIIGFVKITEDAQELRRPIEPGVYVFIRE
ncbi:MAG: hypothetical protein FVQ82_15710 [Planctomycetes bacterium]|nr:hypothetical protein [Planctomycetota bacterium]